MSDNVISMRGGVYRIGDRVLWEGVDADVSPGQIVAVTGPSGCGKTTLLNCFGLLDSLSQGSLHLFGTDIATMSQRQARKLRRSTLSYLFQDFALIDTDSVEQNVSVAMPPRTPRSARADVGDQALEKVGLGGRGKEKVFSLSGGEQQRVSFARILVRQPRLILADEPTASLDKHNADRVMSLLREQAERGAAVVVVTHDERVRDQCMSTVDLSRYSPRAS
ncbi:ABC transporter ATP-binding protein [Corynebacterium sp.]|uniref:ABC transporter ATP-binding protein n=1 Tax=Corynebacterium sp. TaxID=1720 RepID=UPI0026DCB573|nr:ATP-binding cassette domain-containing protein [Corynebacterium sp.]MDO5033194.1 ATP-binding cassette domain-containing protein [Corynebacterium sp.]